jgi:hypothetical protein
MMTKGYEVLQVEGKVKKRKYSLIIVIVETEPFTFYGLNTQHLNFYRSTCIN